MADPTWVALCLVSGVGGKTLRALLGVFGTAEAVLAADDASLQAVPGIGESLSAAIRRANPARAEADLKRWAGFGVRALAWGDSDYPAPLVGLPDAPPLLFVRGQWPLDLTGALAVVGTRTPTLLAHRRASEVAGQVAREGRVIISGLALGIDSAAHHAAIDAGGQTVAVLGCGVLNPYPPESKMLSERLTQTGALLCEVSPQAGVSAPGLIARNRIITGLSAGVLVVQSNTDGGAMHAARFAVGQGRPLYTPGSPLGDPAAAESVAELVEMGAQVW